MRVLSIGTLVLVTLVIQPLPTPAIEVAPVTASAQAVDLADDLVDPASAITLNSANFLIDAAGGGTVQSELRAIGSFTNGNAGGQLPAVNQLDPQNPILYSGGIGISAGVCLSTGLITDDDEAGEDAINGSAVGIEGPNNGFP